MTDPKESNLELVMPFVVCESHGGPYQDEAFVAGFTVGQIAAVLQAVEHVHAEMSWYVNPRLVPQLDLLAMNHSYAMTSEPWEDHEDEWTLVTFAKPTHDGGGEGTVDYAMEMAHRWVDDVIRPAMHKALATGQRTTAGGWLISRHDAYEVFAAVHNHLLRHPADLEHLQSLARAGQDTPPAEEGGSW